MSVAFLVDGLTEQRFIQSICPNAPVRMIGLNGNTVSTAAMAIKICSLIRLWKGRYHPIIVIVDKEDRNICPIKMSGEILELIKNEIQDDVIVGVADRMIENWMIADPDVWGGVELREEVDGIHGANEVKKFLPSYKKSANGPSILQKTRASEIKKRSKSFSFFYEKMSFLKCAWMLR